MGEIFKKMAEVMGSVTAITKERRTQSGAQFNYRGIEDVYNTLQPIMAKAGVFCCPEVLDEKREERVNKNGTAMSYVRLTMRYTFYAGDGSSVACSTLGEAMDSGDKASNKAMSIAHKYAMFQVFCIPTVDMEDPDANADPLPPKGQRQPPPPPPPPPATSALDEQGMRAAFMASQSMAALDEAAARFAVPHEDPKRGVFAEAYKVRKEQLKFTGDAGPVPAPNNGDGPITPAQLKLLQAHYSKWSREERLEDMSNGLGGEVTSFSKLTRVMASAAIEAIQAGTMGVKGAA